MAEKIDYTSNGIIELGNEIKLRSRKIKSDIVVNYIENFFKKKIKFSSAFDHKGSKKFLNSKKVALEEILLEEDKNLQNNSSNNDFDIKNEREKNKKRFIYPYPVSNKSKNKKLKNTYEIISNNKLRNKSLGDEKDNIKKKHLIKTLIENELNVLKEINKNNNFQEMEMLKDKKIKKIKPIKKTKKNFEIINEKDKENEGVLFTFVEGENGSDSSLLNMVSQIK